ncbi:unnamed protein product [Effrenium voratum]|nr:unnamed protein product [Effrenium voratum]
MLRSLLLTVAAASVTKLKFGQDVNYPPYAYLDASGELAGFGVDVVKGMNALCSTLEIEVVQTSWSDCWSSDEGGSLGALLENGTLDACMTFTHTQGIRNHYVDFSHAILNFNKAAGLLTLLEEGRPRVDGNSHLAGLNIVDVGGWAPTEDCLGMVRNKCTGEKYSENYTLLVGDGNDDAMRMLRDGRADAIFIYSDQAKLYQCTGAVPPNWNCSLWENFGTDYAYVQTGQLEYVVNGTSLAMAKKGSKVPAQVNSCLGRFMETQAYYDVCEKHHLLDSCYRNSFFPAGEGSSHHAYKATNLLEGDCSSGYCPCPAPERWPGWVDDSGGSGVEKMPQASPEALPLVPSFLFGVALIANLLRGRQCRSKGAAVKSTAFAWQYPFFAETTANGIREPLIWLF